MNFELLMNERVENRSGQIRHSPSSPAYCFWPGGIARAAASGRDCGATWA